MAEDYPQINVFMLTKFISILKRIQSIDAVVRLVNVSFFFTSNVMHVSLFNIAGSVLFGYSRMALSPWISCNTLVTTRAICIIFGPKR